MGVQLAGNSGKVDWKTLLMIVVFVAIVAVIIL